MSGSASQLGAVAAFTASVTWAFASVRYAEAARDAGPVPVNLLRALSASSLWFCALGAFQGWSALADVSARQVLLLAGSIACSYALGDGLFFAAASRIGVPAAMAIATIYPLWAALYGAFARGEGLGPWRVLGLLACLGGVSALLRLSRAGDGDPATRQAGLWGVVLALKSAQSFERWHSVCSIASRIAERKRSAQRAGTSHARQP